MRMNSNEIDFNSQFNETRLTLSKAKLKAISRTSALLSGFAMVAMVEISLDDYNDLKIPKALIVAYSILTCLVVGVHLLALMISTCILPLLEIDRFSSYKQHEALHIYIEFAWILSTGFGIFLFLLEMTVICWVKFIFVSRLAAIASTTVILPIMIIFSIFSLHFYRRLVLTKLTRHQNELNQIEKRLTFVKLQSIVTMI